MCRKHCCLSEKQNDSWVEVASGNIEIYFDQDTYGARISMDDEDDSLVTNSIIGVNSQMTVMILNYSLILCNHSYDNIFSWIKIPVNGRLLSGLMVKIFIGGR